MRDVESTALRRLEIIEHVTQVGLLPLPPDALLQEVLERVRVGLAATAASIVLPDDEAEGLVVRACAGAPADQAVGQRIPAGFGVAGKVAERIEPALVDDLAAAGPVSPWLIDSGQRSMVAAPLTVAGTVLGVLHVTSDRPESFDEDDVSLLCLLADRVALALEGVRSSEREGLATAALRASEERARAVLETAVDGIVTIDRQGLVESMNPAAERMFGHPASAVIGRNVSMLMPEPFRGEHDEYLDRYHRTGVRKVIGIGREVVGMRADGSTFPLEIAVSELGGDLGLYTGVLRDITERKEFEARLAVRALHDPLTGLANRSLLMERVDHALARLVRHHGLVAVLFVDLDGFKLVNDSFGHDAGDELLLQAAARLRSAVRPEDLVARLGGDEFVLVCEEFREPAEAEGLAQRVLQVLGAPFVIEGNHVFVSASVGVTVAEDGTRSASSLISDADSAMYHSKQQGRRRYTVSDDDMRLRRRQRLLLGDELRLALREEQVSVRYQPVVCLADGEVAAAEALMRWISPSRGMLPPAEFLDVAEEIGVIVDLDAFVLAQACRDAAEWGRVLGRPLGVWVNLSARSLADDALPERVTSALAGAGLDPAQLSLEVAETALMQEADATSRMLGRLRTLGVRLSIDDFGTGFSSLAYLQEFPVHALKVDRSFLGRLDVGGPEAEGGKAIIRAVVGLARSLGLATVAEGVETAEQLEVVTELGCDLGQGFFLGRPAPGERLCRAAGHGVLLPSTFADVVG